MHGRTRFALVALALVSVAAACTSSSSSSTPSEESSSGHGTVGASGGQVATSDGTLTVTIPSGALPSDTQITITEIPSPPDGAIGKTYEIGPTGTQFAVPVTLSFKYGGLDLHGSDPTDLQVATIVDGAWLGLAGNALDTSAQVASGQTTHLSPYGLHAKGKGHEVDSGQSDASEGDSGDTDSSANDSGSNDGGSDGSDGGFDAAGCTQHVLQVGSCANHQMQVCIQTYTFQSCVDLNPGISYLCCAP